MAPGTDDHVPMTVWCSLIPPDEIGKLVKFEDELHMINETYEDWLVSMRSKSLIGSDTGMLLDRIRMLMINIGIACATNREVAEEIQSILSANLRKRALDIVSQMPEESPEEQVIKDTLSMFFSELRFTRDIFPEEEIEKVMTSDKKRVSRGTFGKILGSVRGAPKTADKLQAIKSVILESSNILRRIYMRLLSPDPWGEY